MYVKSFIGSQVALIMWGRRNTVIGIWVIV